MESAPVDRLARFLRDVPPLFTAEKPVSFDPVQMTFLQKLVRETALQGGITIRKEDFFKGTVYADYFIEVIAGRSTILEDVKVLVEELEKIDPYLDVDLTMLVRYSGLYVNKDLKGEAFFKPSSLTQAARRHERANHTVDHEGGAPDLFDRAVGRMVADLFARAEVAPCLDRSRGRADLRAAIVCDAILSALPAEEVSEAARTALREGNAASAAVELTAALSRSCRSWSLKEYVEGMRPS